MNIEEKKRKFIEDIKLYSEKYERDLLNKFYQYWIQIDSVSGLMRFEKQKTFFIKKRLFTFKKLSERYVKKNTVSEYLKAYEDVSKMIDGDG